MKKIISIVGSCLTLWALIPTLSFAACGQVSSSMAPDAITNRIKPAGTVDVEGGGAKEEASVEPEELSANAGELRYKSTCAVCHETGVAGAPKFRNAADWKTRMDVGIDSMLKIAIQGKGGMPPKGTCMQCSDAELKMAIEYMLPK